MRRATLERLADLLPSSRPRWAMMPSGPATHFTDQLLFVASALDHCGIEYVIHYGSLLGAARLGGPLPWDEDHDLFAIGVDLDHIREKMEALLDRHGFSLTLDPRGFFWVRDKIWPAASGHLALAILPPIEPTVADLPIWEGGAPHLAEGELYPLRRLPFHSSYIWGPAETERVLDRLYGASAGTDVMAAFATPPLTPAVDAFWGRCRTAEGLDWPAISERFRTRSAWRHLRHVPWWWFNGGYIIWINKIRDWARARLAR